MFELDHEGAKPTTSVFPFRETEPSSWTADYWQRRGFSGDRVPGGLGSWSEPLYRCVTQGWSRGGEPPCIHFGGTLTPVPAARRWMVVSPTSDAQLASPPTRPRAPH